MRGGLTSARSRAERTLPPRATSFPAESWTTATKIGPRKSRLQVAARLFHPGKEVKFLLDNLYADLAAAASRRDGDV